MKDKEIACHFERWFKDKKDAPYPYGEDWESETSYIAGYNDAIEDFKRFLDLYVYEDESDIE